MLSIAVYNMNKEQVGEAQLSNSVFGLDVKEHLIHQALRVQLANRRAGTVKTKTRSEVAGGGKKPFKQKGTGGARQGCVRAPHYPGGGSAFGPKPKEYNLGMNKKARKTAIRSVLSLHYKNSCITVLEGLDFEKISTKNFLAFMKLFDLDRSLIVTNDLKNNLYLSSRNVPYVKLLDSGALNVYDLLKYKNLIITQDALQSVEGALQL